MNDLRASNGIHVGQNLQIPPDGTPPASETEAATPAPLRDSGGTYTVMRGDTPVSIARKLHVSL